ncbi:hypothetical protein BKA62DRAFT_711964 [Auriculariales sp. MPI-PUGE-AT-0066]|nr:hypothetical protein BKA62DRAFT_711964 [Auriculariales sp. MPI-PUGE-AT-0066]
MNFSRAAALPSRTTTFHPEHLKQAPVSDYIVWTSGSFRMVVAGRRERRARRPKFHFGAVQSTATASSVSLSGRRELSCLARSCCLRFRCAAACKFKGLTLASSVHMRCILSPPFAPDAITCSKHFRHPNSLASAAIAGRVYMFWHCPTHPSSRFVPRASIIPMQYPLFWFFSALPLMWLDIRSRYIPFRQSISLTLITLFGQDIPTLQACITCQLRQKC